MCDGGWSCSPLQRPPATAAHPREADLGRAGTGLWNNQRQTLVKQGLACGIIRISIKIKGNGIWFFCFFFLNKIQVLLCLFCTCMLSSCTQTWSAEFDGAIFIAAAYRETAPNEKQHSKTPISPFCKPKSPKETFAKHGVFFSTGLVETLKLGSATAINTCSLKHPKTDSVSAVTPSAGGPSTDTIFGIADNSQLQEHRVVSCTE